MMISFNDLIQFAYDNFTPLLGLLTVISFCINIIQYNSSQVIKHIFSGIYHTADRAYWQNRELEKSNSEFDSIIISIRYQAITGLRSSGERLSYRHDGAHVENNLIFRMLRPIYRVLIIIRMRLPALIKGADNRYQFVHDSDPSDKIEKQE